jgi:predicted nucleotidyltransferase
VGDASLDRLLGRVLRELDRLGAEPMLVGGLGLMAWTAPRATTDIEVVVAAGEAEVSALGAALARRLGGVASMRMVRFRDGICLQRVLVEHAIGEVAVDLIVANDAFLRQALARRHLVDLPGVGRTGVASPEDLIILKLRAWRDQDLVDAVELARLRALDRAYVEQQAKKLRLLTRWRRLAGKAGLG